MGTRKSLKGCLAAALALAAVCASGLAQAQSAAAPNPPLLMAAGSLRQAMDEIMLAYRAQGGSAFAAQYGPSGKLRQEIEQGRKADVFASASPEHNDRLAAKRIMGPSQVFAHNDLCAVATPEAGLDAENLIPVLASPYVRVATSTPVSDPMGDYTWQFFRKAEKKVPGFFSAMDAKALKLSGATAPRPGEKLPYVTAFENDKADVYLMYCTNAAATRNALPRLKVLRIPDEFNVRSAYGISVRAGSAEGERFARFVMGPEGRKILEKYGFN